jgi:hypothetical protein
MTSLHSFMESRGSSHSPSLDWMAYVDPAQVFSDPDDVIRDEALSLQEKRAILASWASDACAVESSPWLRSWPGSGKSVPVDHILRALVSLDGEQRQCPPAWAIATSRRQQRVSSVRTSKTL